MNWKCASFVCPKCGEGNYEAVFGPDFHRVAGYACRGEFSPPNDYLDCRYKFKCSLEEFPKFRTRVSVTTEQLEALLARLRGLADDQREQFDQIVAEWDEECAP